jgi:hypothetical protein
MKKMIAALILTAAVATPALASDGSESVMNSWAQPTGYTTMSSGMGTFAFAPSGNWQNANNGQWQTQSPIVDR